MALTGCRRVFPVVVLTLAAASVVAHAEKAVSHDTAFEGPVGQVLALTSFDSGLGELVRVRLQISGTASGALGHYGATGKKFVYRGRFSLASTPNTHRDGIIETLQAHGVDGAPPSPDSLAAVDWHVAVYGTLERSSGLAAFTGPGPVYLMYAEESSSLSLRREGLPTRHIDIDESMLRARATVTYIYRPAATR